MIERQLYATLRAMPASLLAALFALAAAAAWGSGDFCGGLVSRRIGALATVSISYAVGMAALAAVALARGELFPAPADVLWGAVAGLTGVAGLGFLMRGFAAGRMGIVAPVSAVLAASLPVIVAALTLGLPGGRQLAGFSLALAGIWLLSRPERLGGRPAGLGLALLAGLGFGLFFIALDQVSGRAVFWPLVAGRLAALAALIPLAVARGRPVLPRGAPWGLLALAGVLDAGGNLFFLLATQTGRLDVAAVLASLYPAVTALLAWRIAGERLTRLQIAGAAAAVVAIALITM
ncbi:MAG TPA: EamA family transporter [Anaerolineae bacterium]|nr:EamA family transporter [Anaerolineae bacterium]